MHEELFSHVKAYEKAYWLSMRKHIGLWESIMNTVMTKTRDIIYFDINPFMPNGISHRYQLDQSI